MATFMMRWLIPRLYSFNALHCKIEIRLTASHVPVDFARDGIDLAIRLGRAPWPRNVVASPFLADRIGPVCAPALLQGRKSLRMSELRGHRLLHAETRRVGIASYALVEDDLRSGRLIAPFGFVRSGRSYCVLHARRAADHPKIAAFRSWIVGAAVDPSPG